MNLWEGDALLGLFWGWTGASGPLRGIKGNQGWVAGILLQLQHLTGQGPECGMTTWRWPHGYLNLYG